MTPTDDQHELYRAYSQRYATEANKRRIAFWIDVAFTVAAAVITALTIRGAGLATVDWLTSWTPPAALLWLAVRELGLLVDDKEHRRTAVMIQEQFDLTFWKGADWQDGWNAILCGKPIPLRAIKDLALSYKGTPLKDDYWLEVPGLTVNDAALLRIQQSSGWGAKGHSRYARLNRVPALIGLISVIVLALIADLAARETAAVLFAVAPFFAGRLQSAREHAALAQRREDLENHIQELLLGEREPKDAAVRSAQDELCRMRLEHRRIPTWLYDRYAEQDRKAIDGALVRLGESIRLRRRQAA